ncbi:MAG: sigma-54 dependent transcriptional regulator [Alphaproteobacteria bacterium]|nr:sigma-54 dependent transcriptional regulator [Alphaproteobacteria bacterium]
MTNEKILVIEDDVTLNALIAKQLSRIGYRVHEANNWGEAEAYLARNEPQLILLDPKLPDADGFEKLPALVTQQPVIVLTAYGSVQNAVKSMQTGAADYMVKPVNLDELELVVQRVLETALLRQEHQFYRAQIQSRRRSFLTGHSPALRRVESLIDSVAPTDMTVLIQGESGVGKELVAHEIHARSPRSIRNFVALDCCTLQETLFESELFGHERGSFTGAYRQKKGLIEGAESGTLFLDEIGEISPPVQAKLLRMLETGYFRRVGGTKDLSANVRIVAATNAELEDRIQDGSFRADLFYRLSTFVIRVPPLRSRREDIPELVGFFIRNHGFSRRVNQTVSDGALRKLTAYDWPGNVRELKNVIERAIILAGESSEIRAEHLTFGASDQTGVSEVTLSFDREPTLEQVRRDYIAFLLERHDGRRADVAQALGISERNLYRLIQKYRLADDCEGPSKSRWREAGRRLTPSTGATWRRF